ncbi:MAG: hypothetical protein FRX48_09635 [Lasallia pustulata]|uniref:Uncharacterized protein n=1 Tax=Lasallia pustulata TaxID=136370 RepID=A0A5M8PCA9_9LECA|nr:MAG: hypothetical protein FRX48_09635 [Lasallia pustulata]
MANPSRSLQEDLRILVIIIPGRVNAVASDVGNEGINLEGEDVAEVSDAESDPHASTWKTKRLLLSSAARCWTNGKPLMWKMRRFERMWRQTADVFSNPQLGSNSGDHLNAGINF